MIKTSGAMFKRFYNDDSAWPENSWHEDEELLVNGDAHEDGSFDDIPDDATIVLSGGTVFGLQNGTETSMELHLKRWLKRQTATVILVECDSSKLDSIKAAVKAAGGENQMSDTINNGELAFPCMTLRDYFAARAMQGIIEKYGSNPPYFDKDGGDGGPDQEIARWAYEIADAMLRAREAK